MPRFSNCGIWKKELNILINSIVDKKALKNWFLDEGVLIFLRARFKAEATVITKWYAKQRSERIISSLANPDYTKQNNPEFTKQDIIDTNNAAFTELRAEFLKFIPESASASDKEKITALFDAFQKTAIDDHQDFYQLEASVVTNTNWPLTPLGPWMFQKFAFEAEALKLDGDDLSDDEDQDYDSSDEAKEAAKGVSKEVAPDPAAEKLANDIYAHITLRDEYANYEYRQKNSAKKTVATSRHSTFATSAAPVENNISQQATPTVLRP
jgi:hypothetical protein